MDLTHQPEQKQIHNTAYFRCANSTTLRIQECSNVGMEVISRYEALIVHLGKGMDKMEPGNTVPDDKKVLETAPASFRSPHSNTETAAGTEHVVRHIHTLYHFARLFQSIA